MCSFSAAGMHINDCAFDGFLDINKCSGGEITISKCWPKKWLVIRDSTVNAILLSQNNVAEYCSLLNCPLTNSLSIFGGEYKESVHIQSCSGQVLSIEDAKFQKSVEVTHDQVDVNTERTFHSLAIRRSSFGDGFLLSGINRMLPLSSALMNNVILECSTLLQGDIHIDSVELNSVQIKGFNTKANLKLSNIAAGHFLIEDFYNYSQLVLSNITGPQNAIGTFQLVRSNLGKAQLDQFDFRRFGKIKMEHVVLNEITIANIAWFNLNMLRVENEDQLRQRIRGTITKTDEPTSDWIADLPQSVARQLLAKRYSDVREIFRQLKYALEKNGDRPQSLAMQSEEMEYYRRYVNLTGEDEYNYNRSLGKPSWIHRVFIFFFGKKQLWQDKFILLTNLSNEHGQNWWRPMWLLFAAALIFYFPTAFCASNLECSFAPTVWDLCNTLKVFFWYQLRIYPQLLNPTHDLSKMIEHKNLPGVLYFSDFLCKLVVSYFLFQIITAFRKYVK